MKHFFTLMIGLFAGSALAQNYGTPASQNGADNDSPLPQLNPAAGTRAGENIVLPPEGAVAPPPGVRPPLGIAPPPGETGLPPGGTATAPQGTPTAPPPIAPARR